MVRSSSWLGSVLTLLVSLVAFSATLVHAAEPVISLNYQGDRLQRLTGEPTLSILDDGQVIMPQVYVHTQSYQGQIGESELGELLSFIRAEGFFDNDFSDLDSTPMRRESHQTKTIVYANDGAASRQIAVTDLRNQESAVELQAIVQRLEHIMSVVKLGGESGARDWLDRANAELQLKHPALPPLVLGNLQSGVSRSDGSINVVFSRATDDVRVTLSVDASGQFGSAVFP